MSATATVTTLTPTQAAIRANRSEKTIRRWIHDGHLAATRCPMSGRLTIEAADLEELLRRQPAVEPKPAA
jgi:excisionase family DNA binding protein